ncbi:MAG: hypothetical protein LPJ92_01770 [Rhodobacterales bacterium]|nr:hypothetical protein [Rhodobacterales bacterium]MDX5389042.1 hypothetical protein [Rhodobacterales bacterium]MDX5488731.1 hypothetical protein [Rhodobacterales bacterium]
MSVLTVTKTRLFQGMWEGIVTGAPAGTRPSIAVTHLEQPVPGAEVLEAAEGTGWVLRIPIPREALSDGIHTFLIRDGETGETLNSFAILAGEALASDIRAEVDLLREELDLLKRAFRRHCLETM